MKNKQNKNVAGAPARPAAGGGQPTIYHSGWHYPYHSSIVFHLRGEMFWDIPCSPISFPPSIFTTIPNPDMRGDLPNYFTLSAETGTGDKQ